MDDPLTTLEAWLTYVNVEVLGLRPFHFNLFKAPLLLLGFSVLLWAVFLNSSAERIARFVQWCHGLSCRRLIFTLSGLLTIGLSYLSLKQFYFFTGGRYDLAVYSNSLWHTIHGEWFFDSVNNDHLLGDHFAPILIVFAQLYRLWESPVWLLMVQTLALGLGGIALGLITHRLTGSSVTVLVLLLLYVSNPYLHSIAGLSFHPISLAIPVFLWLLYCLDTERYWVALTLACVALLVEESLPPGLVGVGIYVFVFRPQYRWTGLVVALLGALWFMVEVTIFLPHFSQRALIHWDRYANLGPDFPSALYNIATDPLFLVTEAFVRDYKIYYLAALLVSVGFLPLFAWRQTTLIVLPALMMLLSQHDGQYKFGFHYSAVVLPFLFYSAAYGIASIRGVIEARFPKRVWSERVLFIGVMALLILNIYQARGYRLKYIDHEHVAGINTVLEVLPPGASVRSEVNMVAVLSSRHQIAKLGDTIEKNFEWWVPEYFVLDFKLVEHDTALLAARRALMDHLIKQNRYSLVKQVDGVMLFKIAQQDRSSMPGAAQEES